jgi:hypothetical protein
LGFGSITSLKRQLVSHVFKYMVEEYRKFSNQSSGGLMYGRHFILGKLLPILQGTEITGTTQEEIKCWWCVIQFLETLPLNALGS